MSTRTKDYILTESGNHISRHGLKLVNTQGIVLGGKTIIESDVTIRGDARVSMSPANGEQSPQSRSTVTVGRYCRLEAGCSLIPPRCKPVLPCNTLEATAKVDEEDHFAMKIGDYVQVGRGSRISSLVLGSYVRIGRDVVLADLCIVKDGVVIEDGTFVPPYTVVPPFTRLGGRPARAQPTAVEECFPERWREQMRRHYDDIIRQSGQAGKQTSKVER